EGEIVALSLRERATAAGEGRLDGKPSSAVGVSVPCAGGSEYYLGMRDTQARSASDGVPSLALRACVGSRRWRSGLVWGPVAGAPGLCGVPSLALRACVGSRRWRSGLVWGPVAGAPGLCAEITCRGNIDEIGAVGHPVGRCSS